MGDTKKKIREFILREFLPGESEEDLEETTPLITGGILDSIGALKLVLFLQEEFGIEVAAHEVDTDHLNSLNDITALVEAKL